MAFCFMKTNSNGEPVAGVADPASQNGSTEAAASGSGYNLPNSRKVYVAGKRHAALRVPFREISLAPTKSMNGEIEVNEPVRVYDTSGPWSDPDFHGDVRQGLPALREKWIRDRGDVEEIEGRKVTPIDDGYLSDAHAAHAASNRPTLNAQRSTSNSEGQNGNGSGGKLSTLDSSPSTAAQRRPLRARAGRCVTQLAYARRGIITPEMEFIAVRENLGRAQRSEDSGQRSDSKSSSIQNLGS